MNSAVHHRWRRLDRVASRRWPAGRDGVDRIRWRSLLAAADDGTQPVGPRRDRLDDPNDRVDAYRQVAALGRAGEPETRIVVYFSVGGVIVGAASTLATGGPSVRTGRGVALLLAGSALATVAQLTMTRAYTIGRAPVNASLQYLGIGFSFIYGVLMFNDPVATAALVGMASIVAAGTAATPLRNALQPRDALPSTLET